MTLLDNGARHFDGLRRDHDLRGYYVDVHGRSSAVASAIGQSVSAPSPSTLGRRTPVRPKPRVLSLARSRSPSVTRSRSRSSSPTRSKSRSSSPVRSSHVPCRRHVHIFRPDRNRRRDLEERRLKIVRRYRIRLTMFLTTRAVWTRTVQSPSTVQVKADHWVTRPLILYRIPILTRVDQSPLAVSW